jgi:hypothetical protein
MVQELDVEIDIERLRTEVFNFIVENKFGYKGVSLRMPPGNTNYVDHIKNQGVDGYSLSQIDLIDSSIKNKE